MKSRLSSLMKRCVHGTVLACAAFFGPAGAQTANFFAPVTHPAQVTPGQAAPAAQVVRNREVSLNTALIQTGVLTPGSSRAAVQDIVLNLFDDIGFNAIPDQISQIENGISWIGHLDGIEGSQVILVMTQGVLSGNITLPGKRFQVRPLPGGSYQVQEIDGTKFPPDHPPASALPDMRRPPAEAARDASQQADDGTTIDVMVVYTPAARSAAGGTAAMQSLINLGITETNTAYQNSGITQRVRLVRAEEVNYVETQTSSVDGFSAALNCLTNTSDGCLDGIHASRNTYGADLVSLWIEGGGGACGIGWQPSSAATGFNVVARDCATGNYSFGHEMGHNMGAGHDVFVDSSANPYAYGHGYANIPAGWRTIMAYNDACAASGKNCTRIQYFSNPSVSYNGLATGNASTADNHRALNNTAFTVANFRASNSCAYQLSSTSFSLGAGATSVSVNVTASAGCSWTASSNTTGLAISSGSSGSGNGTVVITVAANTLSNAVMGTLTIAGQTVTVVQSAATACSYALGSTGSSLSAAASLNSLTVSTTSNCAWTASSNASWLTITSGASGQGSGTVGYSVAANTSTAPRTGVITVQSQTLSITQAGAVAGCSYTLAYDYVYGSAAGGSYSMGVTAPTGCSWTAASNSSWLGIVSGASGIGSGSVTVGIARNTSSSNLVGSTTIAGKLVPFYVAGANSTLASKISGSFSGGAGINTVVHMGHYHQYAVSNSVSGSTATFAVVRDTVAGRDGTTTLTHVQRLQFANLNLALDLASPGSAGGIYRLYGATFNRDPDLLGLGYWISRSDEGLSATDLASSFTYTAEFKALYGANIVDNYGTGVNVNSLVSGFYTNVLHRTPDQAGLDFYVGQIAGRQKTIGQTLAEISDSSENRSQFLPKIQNGIVYLPWRGSDGPSLRYSTTVATLAGTGIPGSANGASTVASFNGVTGVAVDRSGNLYVTETANHLVRKISPAGLVTTLAGSGTPGMANGTGTAASFNQPFGIAVDNNGTVYVADTYNHLIRKITASGVVTTLAGNGTPGTGNGVGTGASFTYPTGIAVDASGTVYVADYGNHRIRLVTPQGAVSHLAGSGTAGALNGQGSAASFNNPYGVAVDASGSVYVTDFNNHQVRTISANGLVGTLAGSGSAGNANGTGTAASFNGPTGIAVDANGNVVFSDRSNQKIRLITPAGVVTTLAGVGTAGSANGLANNASFNAPNHLAVDSAANLYLADTANQLVRMIVPATYSSP